MEEGVRFVKWLALILPVAASWAMTLGQKEKAEMVFRDIAYRSGGNGGHKLDIYLPPKLDASSPVLIMVHGGAWISGTKAVYEPLARNFAQEGMVAIVPEYRLSPETQHPSHADDVRDAIQWTVAQSAKYGFSTAKIILMGHSAGAHIAATLAADPKGLPAGVPAAFIGIAGIYDLPALDKRWPGYDTWFLNVAFGPRGPKWKDASPAQAPAKNRGRWLLIQGEGDELVDVDQTRAFAAHLKSQKIEAELLIEKNLDHFGVLRDLGAPRNPFTPQILSFIRK